MSTKNTLIWAIIAVALLAFIVFFERHLQKPSLGPEPLLKNFKAANVTSLTVRPAEQPAIRMDRTNSDWSIVRPIGFPAQKTRIEAALTALERIIPATIITPSELHRRPKAEEEFDFDNAQVTVDLQQGDQDSRTVKFGRRTAPGDQVFVRIVGREDIYVVDAEILKLFTGSANDWRDTSLVDWSTLVFDRLTVTNAGKLTLALQLDTTNQIWRLARPANVRADAQRVQESLQSLLGLKITSFVSDKTNADLDVFGLSPADLSLTFTSGTNNVAVLSFGKTNSAGDCFARRAGIDSIVTVPMSPLAPWRELSAAFRDRQLIAVSPQVKELEVNASESFTLQRELSNNWHFVTHKFAPDPAFLLACFQSIDRLRITDSGFHDAVTGPELVRYGLTSAVYQATLKVPASAGSTNTTATRISFGATNGNIIYARRSDEDSVYEINLADFQKLPTAAWQLRDRRVWNFNSADLTRVIIRQSGKTRELLRSGTNSWSLASGSQGVINTSAIESGVRDFAQLDATAWSAHGPAAQDARFGITPASLAITFETKAGEKFDIQFGALSPEQYPYARVTLDGEPWVFEFQKGLFQLVLTYFSIPATP